MIEFKKGNMFEDDAQALVNTINCVGVMGAGIALQFKPTFPANYEEYVLACDAGDVVPGRMFITENQQFLGPKYIVNFPTKRHWQEDSRMEDIESGLADLVREIQTREIQSIAIPPLGCGLGGLDWPEVRNKIVEAMQDLDVDVRVYEPIEL